MRSGHKNYKPLEAQVWDVLKHMIHKLIYCKSSEKAWRIGGEAICSCKISTRLTTMCPLLVYSVPSGLTPLRILVSMLQESRQEGNRLCCLLINYMILHVKWSEDRCESCSNCSNPVFRQTGCGSRNMFLSKCFDIDESTFLKKSQISDYHHQVSHAFWIPSPCYLYSGFTHARSVSSHFFKKATR